MKTVRATMRAAFAESRANRSAFVTQLLAMALNDIVWVVFWVLFFRKVGTLRGWDRDRVLLLFAMLTTAAGFVLGILSNSRRIGQLASDGGLDAALALPVPTLRYLLVRRVDAVNIGDFVFGITLFLVLGHPTPERIAIYVFGSIVGATVLASFLVIVGSTAFFVGRGEPGELGMHAIIMLASYPADVFAGAAKAILYTAVPAAFVATAPARLIDDFSIGAACVMVAVAALFAFAAWLTFTLGLRRYTSSAFWTRA